MHRRGGYNRPAMSDDDFPYLAEDRRNFRKQVAVGVVGVLFTAGLLVMKCSKFHQERRAIHEQMALHRAVQDHSSLPTPAAPSTLADEPAVELELVYGQTRADVVGPTIGLGDGRTLEVQARPRWTYVGEGMSLTHDSSLRVTKGNGSVIVNDDDALAEVFLLESDVSGAEAIAGMAQGYESTGQVVSSEATTLTLLGREVHGKRIHTAGGMGIELAATDAGKGKQLRVIITATGANADPSEVREAVQSVTLARRAATPELDVALRRADGETIGAASATIGKPFEIGGERMTIAWRKTVRQQRDGMRFEHAPGVAVTSIRSAAPTVSLRSGEIVIQVMIAPFAIAPEELNDAIGATIGDSTLITRTFGGVTYRGIAGELHMGELIAHTEAFSFDRGGRPFIVMIQSPAGQAKRAGELAEPVVVSVQ